MPLMDEVAEIDLNDDQQKYQQQKQEEEAARRKEIADNFVLQRRHAVGNMLQLASDIAARIDDPVEATRVTAEFYEQVATMFADGQRIADDFISQAGANQAQVRELEGRTHELEQQLADAQGNQSDLERSAQRASDLQIEVNELKRENNRLQQEMDALTDETDQVRRDLVARDAEYRRVSLELDRITSEKNAAIETSDAWQSQAENAQAQLRAAQARIAELEQNDRGSQEPAEPHGPADTDAGSQPASQDSSTGQAEPTGQSQPAGDTDGDEQPRRLIGDGGAFNGDQSAAPADDEAPQARRRLPRPTRRSRRGRPTNPDQNDN